MPLINKAIALFALYLMTNVATAGEWEKTRMSPDFDYGYDTSLPAFTYRSDLWLPHERADITVLVPKDMPDWVRAIRPYDTAAHSAFYASIVDKVRTGARPSDKMLRLLQYCYKKIGEDDPKMGECLYLTAQVNMEIMFRFALDASAEGKFESAQPMLYNRTTKARLSMSDTKGPIN